MSSVSPVPGLIQHPARPTADRPVEPSLLHRWALRLLAHEPSDLPARIAIGASCLAAVFSLGEVVLGPEFLGFFPYRITRSLLYMATFLSGCIMAGGFLSRSRTARYTALVATTTIATYYLAIRLGLPGEVLGALKVGYGVALLGGAVVWALRALRRRLTHDTP